ncbi:hypothetical protein [Bradyrhizobium diazoefficiens]
MDLFAPGIAHSAVGVPEWRELPKEAQDALVNLMMQLVLDHAVRYSVAAIDFA